MTILTSRLSQALHTYGTGAVADFPDISLIIASPDIDSGWGVDNNDQRKKVKIEDIRLASVFGVDYFVQPPLGNTVTDPDQQTLYYAIKAHRFPNVLQCSSCKGLYYINEDLKILQNNTIAPAQQPDNRREGFKCPVCNPAKPLSPSRFVIATEDGHLDDFPWDWFVHRNAPDKEIKRYKKGSEGNTHSCLVQKNKRNLKMTSTGPSLSNIYIECTQCGASEGLGAIFDQEETFITKNDNYLWFTNSMLAMPQKQMTTIKQNERIVAYSFWRERTNAVTDNGILNAARNNSAEWSRIKAKYPRTLQRGASNIYFPVGFKGISIPNYLVNQDSIHAVPEDFIGLLNRILEHHTDLVNFETDTEKIYYLINLNDAVLWGLFGYNGTYSAKDIKKYIIQLYPSPDTVLEETSEKKTKLRKEEFDFFITENQDIPIDFWYKSRSFKGDALGEISSFIDELVLFDKLREVRVLKGFTRVRPLAFEDLIFAQNRNEIEERYRNEFARIRDVRINDGTHIKHDTAPSTNWLPGIEVKGEGFFLKFNDEVLDEWKNIAGISDRVETLQRNYMTSLKRFGSIPDDFEGELVNARYLLTHTVSHIIIDALVNDSGYNAASLSEIIYCSKETDNFKMNGILIYTSSPDAEGTLGGLADQGNPNNLNRIFRKALEKARWCSSDPLCIETEHGQGFMGVNLAACHSCCMLPETSCENANKFLDRAMLVGSLTNPNFGFFKHINYI